MTGFRLWWHKPELHTDEEQGRERRVSWLELFYDLVFVVMIARLSHYLAYHVGLEGTLSYLLLFIPVWWVWISGTIYNDRFETYDVSYRLIVFLQILVVGAMSIFIEGGTGKHADAFAWSYAAARLLIVLMWWRGGRHNPSARPVTNRYVTGFSVSIVLWVISTFVEGPLSFALKGLGLLVDLITPIFTLPQQSKLPRFSNSKLGERFGLFMIIVLGESIVGVLNGITENEALDWLSVLRLVLGMALSFGLWWIYFDFIGRRKANRGRVWVGLAWSYLHLPLVMGITAVAASLLHVMNLGGGEIETATHWTLVGAYALVMISMGLLEHTLLPENPGVVNTIRSSNLKLLTAGVALVLGFLISPTTFVLALLVLLNLGHMLYGAISWFSSPVSRHLAEASEEI
jgi:low temperature requirement protein LtrA